MQLQSLIEWFDVYAPKSLGASWDNEGEMVVGSGEHEIKKILISLDLTRAVLDYAVEGGFDCVITHHPMIFSPLKSIEADSTQGGMIFDLIRHGIDVLSYHSRLDSADGGVNDCLCGLLGIEDIRSFGIDESQTLGRIGNVSPTTLGEFASRVKQVLNSPHVAYSADSHRRIERVAVVGGSGKDFARAAFVSGADVFVTGEMGYNAMLGYGEAGMCVITAGHFHTECIVLERLAEEIRGSFVCEAVVYSGSDGIVYIP